MPDRQTPASLGRPAARRRVQDDPRAPAPPTPTGRCARPALAALLAAALCASCGDDRLPPDTPDAATLLGRWNEGLVALDQHRFADAKAAFARVTKDLPKAADAFVNYGIACMNGVTPELFGEAERAFLRALELVPDHLHAHHCIGVLLKHLGRNDEAAPHFRAVLAKDDEDPTAHYYLGTLLVQAGKAEDAERHLKAALAAEPHLSSAIHKLFQIYVRAGRTEGRDALKEAFAEFERSETGNKAGIVYTEMGRYGEAVRTYPGPLPPSAPDAPLPTRSLGTPVSLGKGGGPRLSGFSIPAQTRWTEFAALVGTSLGPGLALADVDADGDQDAFLAASPAMYFRNDRGSFVDATSSVGLAGVTNAVSATFGDLDNDGDPDLYVACVGPNRLFRNDRGSFVDVTAESGADGGARCSVQAVIADFDADGDLDLYVVNLCDLPPSPGQDEILPTKLPPTRNVLLNNDRTGVFTDLTDRAGLGGDGGPSVGAFASDLDGDRDADLVVLRDRQPPLVFRNDRILRFVECAAVSGLERLGAARGLDAGDLDHDGDLDLVAFAPDGPRALRNDGRLRFSSFAPFPEPARTTTTGVVFDEDNDGDLEILLEGPEGTLVVAPAGPGGTFEVVAADGRKAPELRAVLAVDVDLDGSQDLLAALSPGGLEWRRGPRNERNASLPITLRGVRETGKTRTNTGGLGATVLLTTGVRTQVREIRSSGGILGGPAQIAHFGVGRAPEADAVRILWPDDVVQGESHLPAGQPKTITQVYRKGSSCPLLFAFDGEQFAFVTDFLGTGGLGFFLEPGVYAPPDPTEAVKIPRLAARNGRYELRIHEPMEEILYLDRATLLVIDHPADREVFPDERLAVGGPPATGRAVVFRKDGRRHPIGLETTAGVADPECLRHADRRYQPGVHPDRRFLGYAAPQTIVLDFGAALRDASTARPLFLALDGWVEYPYAHVNFAALQAGLRLEGLSLDAETKSGTWVPVLPDFGYPAGMPRTMLVDVSAVPRDGTGRLRLRTTMELWIDELYLAEDVGLEGTTITELRASNATLRQSGYPREYSPDGREPLLYDYALMDPAIDFKTMGGAYTRFGDVRELLDAADDRYVVLGRAEEIALDFEAPPPPAPGLVRSFILASDGWCKDMDLYTAFPETVAPLPFRAMTGYPYPETESFPTGPAFDDWQQRYQTRFLPGSRGSGRGR